MKWGNLIAVAVALLASSLHPSRAADSNYVREDIRIPMAAAGPRGLEAMLLRPAAPGRYPLLLLTHGSPRQPADRPQMTPAGMQVQAVEFARRGFAVAVVMRRGFGLSGGGFAESFGSCGNPDYLHSGLVSAADLRAAISSLAGRPEIDAAHIVAVGVSAGGLAVVALTAEPPPGLLAAISFAGGRGSRADDDVCHEERLVEAFRSFGTRSRVPMLWVYAENDHFFGPALAQQFRDAFAAGGGRLEFVRAPAFASDGHMLFSAAGRPIWLPLVDSFLKRQNLMPRSALLPPPALAALASPPQLSVAGRRDFDIYLASGTHKAFAVSADGHYGWRTGRRSAEDAKSGALEFCGKKGKNCRLYAVDDMLAR